MNNNVDLNIKNYNFNDLLKLFNLNKDYTNEDLKICYKFILKTHPDKSGLEPKFFIFYTKAFKILKNILIYTQQFKISEENNCNWKNNNEYNEIINYQLQKERITKKIENETPNKDLIKIINNMPKEEFNRNFNLYFEKVKNEMTDEYENDGYDEWFKSNDDIDNNNHITNTRDMNNYIERKKKVMINKQITKYNDVTSINYLQNTENSLSNKKKDYYGSNPFCKNKFEDLKHAYTETIVPINEEELLNRKRFTNTQQMQIFRKHQLNNSTKNYNNHNEILNNEKQKEYNQSQILAHEFIEEREKTKEFNNKFLGYFRQLTNK